MMKDEKYVIATVSRYDDKDYIRVFCSLAMWRTDVLFRCHIIRLNLILSYLHYLFFPLLFFIQIFPSIYTKNTHFFESTTFDFILFLFSGKRIDQDPGSCDYCNRYHYTLLLYKTDHINVDMVLLFELEATGGILNILVITSIGLLMQWIRFRRYSKQEWSIEIESCF